MTTTDAETRTMDPAELAGKTRAELLELCRARGLKATAWKRGRMEAALAGQDEPVAAPKKNVLAGQLDARREERAGESDAKKARENMLKRTGACQSTVCRAGCQAFELGEKDAFGWTMCVCGHTMWAHAVGAAQPAPEDGPRPAPTRHSSRSSPGPHSPVGPGLPPFPGRPPGFRGRVRGVKNRYRLLELAAEHGVPVKKQLKAWNKEGGLVVLEVDRPLDELAAELRSRGIIP